MITVKEYAIEKGISHQAVYKKLSLHREEVAGHVVLVDGIKYLDPVAVEVLEQNRTNDPRIEKLEKEIKKLKIERTKLKKKLKEREDDTMQLGLQMLVNKENIEKINRLESENEQLSMQLACKDHTIEDLRSKLTQSNIVSQEEKETTLQTASKIKSKYKMEKIMQFINEGKK